MKTAMIARWKIVQRALLRNQINFYTNLSLFFSRRQAKCVRAYIKSGGFAIKDAYIAQRPPPDVVYKRFPPEKTEPVILEDRNDRYSE